MILSRLTLTNFCLYAGTHEFELEPSRGKSGIAPIILFGGVNGAGKTTILDAVQLVLFGKRAQCSKRFDKPYDEFLRQSIHRGPLAADSAAIGLTFRYAARGQEDVFEVVRTWKASPTTIRETVRVTKNGAFDDWLSTNWNQVVEELIPYGIAQLCFFDAEKIRYLADDETSSQALGEAIRSLLGLDLAERLIADTDVLSSRIVKRNQSSDKVTDIETLEAEYDNISRLIENTVQELGAFENPKLAAKEQVRKAEEKFARSGGKHWESRTELHSKKAVLEQSRVDIQNRLIELSAGELPLAMVENFLQRVDSQVRLERQSSNQSSMLSLLEERDAALIGHLRSQVGDNSTILDTTQHYLANDRLSRRAVETHIPRLKMSEGADARLRHLLNGQLSAPLATAQQLLNDYENCGRELSAIQRSLNSIPAEESIRAVAEKLKTASMEFATCEQNARRVEKQLAAHRFQRDEIAAKLSKLREKAVNVEIKSEEDKRVTALLDRTRVAMTRYLQVATTKKIDGLSERITESFRFLMRKESLIERVAIDPATFEIVLHAKEGSVISKQRLSEGEKQLFAVSVLWGLARSSARPLPAIIDTPMGRLDAKHRDHLVQRYFPNASHQVIILSTDTEVERGYFDALQPSVARAYHLRYDDTQMCTIAEEGYFWARAGAV